MGRHLGEDRSLRVALPAHRVIIHAQNHPPRFRHHPNRRLARAFDQQQVTVKEIVPTQEIAEAEVERLQKINPKSRYIWRVTRWVQ